MDVNPDISPFMRCADLHEPHWSLEEAKRCFDQIDQPEDGIAVNPATGKCIHTIAAVATDGTQRKFSDKELDMIGPTLTPNMRVL